MGDPYAAFERDIPERLREAAMCAMAEATGGWAEPSNVYILERDRLDAINCRAHGIITIEGQEYTFQMEDGNRNGTELLAWESDQPFERHEPTRWALQPVGRLIYDALEKGRGPFLLLKWDAILKNRPEVAAIPGKYTYDRYVQPGVAVEKHWTSLAAKHHFEIVTEETAQATRRKLSEAVTPAIGVEESSR